MAVIPRHKPNWPAPGAYETEGRKRFKELGTASNPLPVLLPGGKAISAATIRIGLGWMEIPFVATQVKDACPRLTFSNLVKPFYPKACGLSDQYL